MAYEKILDLPKLIKLWEFKSQSNLVYIGLLFCFSGNRKKIFQRKTWLSLIIQCHFCGNFYFVITSANYLCWKILLF